MCECPFSAAYVRGVNVDSPLVFEFGSTSSCANRSPTTRPCPTPKATQDNSTEYPVDFKLVECFETTLITKLFVESS
jgi:hypothetical protein